MPLARALPRTINHKEKQMSASQVSVELQPEFTSPCSGIPPSDHNFPEFPQAAYLGIGAEFADLYAQRYESPKEFFYFDFLMIMGTSLSGSVRADFGDLKTHTRDCLD